MSLNSQSDTGETSKDDVQIPDEGERAVITQVGGIVKIPSPVLVVPFGVKDSELPLTTEELGRTVPRKEINRSVAIPFNAFRYLQVVNEIAEQAGAKFDVLVAGINRLVRKYGPEIADRILTGHGDSEQRAYLEHLLKLEEIRSCIIEAVIRVLDLSSFRNIVMTAHKMREDSSFRDAVLNTVNFVRNRISYTIDFYGGETTIRTALRKSLPSHKRASEDGDGEFDYLGAELGLIKHAILHEGSMYYSHLGSETSPTDKGDKTILECFRETGIGVARMERGDVGTEDMPQTDQLMAARWHLSKKLDGKAFYKGAKGGAPKSVSPYYLNQEHLDVGLDDQCIVPLRVPGCPWHKGWVRDHMTSRESGGIASGQAMQLTEESLNPVLRRWSNVLRREEQDRGRWRGAIPLSVATGYKFKGLMEWLDDFHRKGVPRFCNVDDYNDLVRVVCEDIGTEALAIFYKRKGGEKEKK